MQDTILLTGVSGFFGRALLPRLQADPAVKHIIGVDLRPPVDASQYSKLTFHQLDVREGDLAPLMKRCDVVIHMAFILMRPPRRLDLDAVNIVGSRRVLRAAAQAGVPKIIFTSSVVGYGLHPDNPMPLTEIMPRRPNAGL